MNFTQIQAELERASSFDLYRLQAVIQAMLDDSARIVEVKRALRVGMEITYFDEQQNRLIPARILQIRKTRALIEELETGKRWTILLYMIKLDRQASDPAPTQQQLDRLSAQVGQTVGFVDREGLDLFGTIIKLNPKRAKIETERGIWTVPYPLLFTVIDGDSGEGVLLLATD